MRFSNDVRSYMISSPCNLVNFNILRNTFVRRWISQRDISRYTHMCTYSNISLVLILSLKRDKADCLLTYTVVNECTTSARSWLLIILSRHVSHILTTNLIAVLVVWERPCRQSLLITQGSTSYNFLIILNFSLDDIVPCCSIYWKVKHIVNW